MRTQDIEIILAICRHGSFSRAADSLSLSQPAVSLAVKRVEEELETRIFDRSGSAVTLTGEGSQVVRGFERIVEILGGIKRRGADTSAMRIGISPLLSGRDVTALLAGQFRTDAAGLAIEFLDSDAIAARSDFDVKVMVPALRRRSTVHVEFPIAWIGVDNGVFIRSRQEAVVWDRAMHTLIDNGVPVTRVIEVNDCGYAYHMASSGAGFTACVMTPEIGLESAVLPHLPAMAPIRLDIFASPDLAERVRTSLADQPDGDALPLAAAS